MDSRNGMGCGMVGDGIALLFFFSFPFPSWTRNRDVLWGLVLRPSSGRGENTGKTKVIRRKETGTRERNVKLEVNRRRLSLQLEKEG